MEGEVSAMALAQLIAEYSQLRKVSPGGCRAVGEGPGVGSVNPLC